MLKALPENSVVAIDAHPSDVESLALLSNKTLVLFRESTVSRVAFEKYDVTHALDYAVKTSAIDVASTASEVAPPSAFTKWLIHLVR